MGEMILTKTRIHGGKWEGVLKAPAADEQPRLAVWHLETALPGVELAAIADRPGRWRVSVPIPAELLSDGVQSFVIREEGSGDTLGHFTIVTGVPLEDDIRAEVDLLRAELDLLKKAFRRHVVQTAG